MIEIVWAGEQVTIDARSDQLEKACKALYGGAVKSAPDTTEPTIILEEVTASCGSTLKISGGGRETAAATQTFASMGALLIELRDRVQYQLIKDNREGFVIHGGLAHFRGCNYLFPALSGSGKTSLAAWFLDQGGLLLSDEISLVELGGDVSGFPQALNVKAGGIAVVEQLERFKNFRETALPSIHGGLFLPWQQSALPNIADCPLQIIQPAFNREASALRAKPMSGAEKMQLLMENCLNIRNFPDHPLGKLKQICEQFQGIKLEYGSFEQLGGFFQENSHLSVNHPESSGSLQRQ